MPNYLNRHSKNKTKITEFEKKCRILKKYEIVQANTMSFSQKTEFKFVIFDGTIKVLYILYLYKFVNLSQNSK